MKKENVILIVTDQHRIDSLKIYNKNSICDTPNIDKLFRDGVAFSNCYTSNPVCSPARSSMHSGLYPSKTGIEANIYEGGCRTHELQDNELLLSRRLINRGYIPLYTGKWHLGLGKDKSSSDEGQLLLDSIKRGNMTGCAYENYGTMPTDIGYIGDDFPGHGNGGWNTKPYKEYLEKNNLELEIVDKKVRSRQGDHTTTGVVTSSMESTIEYFITERAIELIDENKGDKPFFLCLNYWGPHEPFFPHESYYEKFKNMKIPKWDSFNEENLPVYDILKRPEKDWSFFENSLRHYYACIEQIDGQLGRLFEKLDEWGIYENTTIIFTSDHGDYQGTHGKMENKSYGMYDDITKVPFIVKPAKGHEIDKEDIISEYVGTCDVYATILDFAGEKADDGKCKYNDGRSVKQLVMKETKKVYKETWENEIVTEGMGAFPLVVTQRMYCKNNFKYVFNFGSKEQLFNLKEDPKELRNLVDLEEYRDIYNEMIMDFSKWMERHNDPIVNSFCKIKKIGKWALS